MYTKEKAIDYLKAHLDPWRVEHSLRVMDLAVRMANKYGADAEKTEMAALLHDCGKWADPREALKKVESFGIIIDGELSYDFNLVHGILGSLIAQEEFGIFDDEVLNAIRYHITGRWDMSLIEKIVYIADLIEPARDFPKVDRIRAEVDKNLDQGILMAMDETILHLIAKRHFIGVDTLEARNFLLVEGKN